MRRFSQHFLWAVVVSLLITGCVTSAVRDSFNGFSVMLPATWEITKAEKSDQAIQITRKNDNEDTGIAFISLNKYSGDAPQSELLKKYTAEIETNSKMSVVVSEEKIRQFAGIKGYGIKKSGKTDAKEGEMPIEYLFFMPDSESNLAGCMIIIFRLNDHQWRTMKEASAIVRGIRLN